nr:MAG TPA: hypothetical protein [Caudoviricetes sp.]
MVSYAELILILIRTHVYTTLFLTLILQSSLQLSIGGHSVTIRYLR